MDPRSPRRLAARAIAVASLTVIGTSACGDDAAPSSTTNGPANAITPGGSTLPPSMTAAPNPNAGRGGGVLPSPTQLP